MFPSLPHFVFPVLTECSNFFSPSSAEGGMRPRRPVSLPMYKAIGQQRPHKTPFHPTLNYNDLMDSIRNVAAYIQICCLFL